MTGNNILSKPKKIALPRIPEVPKRIAVFCCHALYKKLPPPPPTVLAESGAQTSNAVFMVAAGRQERNQSSFRGGRKGIDVIRLSERVDG